MPETTTNDHSHNNPGEIQAWQHVESTMGNWHPELQAHVRRIITERAIPTSQYEKHSSVQENDNSPEVIARLARDLRGDFYKTFLLSQGEPAIQPPLFVLLAKKHHQAGHDSLMEEALHTMDERIEQLLPPKRHIETDEQGRNDKASGFRALWNEYSSSLLNPHAEIIRSHQLVLDDMLARDLHYQKQGRPNRRDGDRYESIVREYIIKDGLAGSQQLLQVRDDLRATLLSQESPGFGDEWMRLKLHELGSSWEDNHSGEHFLLSANP